MGQYRKKPVVIEAVQLPQSGDFNLDEFHAWARAVGFTEYTSERDETLCIRTLEGDYIAQPGDWIIKGVAGEFSILQAAIFEATYEAV